MSEANPLPTSAEIIGFLVKTLEWDLDHQVKERTWRNYIAGKPVGEKTREAIFDALARAFLGPKEDFVLPTGQTFSKQEVVRNIRNVFMAQARFWDDIRAQLPEGANPKVVPLLTIVALRLAIIDLALRFAAFLLLQKELQPPEEPEASGATESTPALEENVLGRLLRELLKSAGLTRDALAERLDVSKQAVDKWLDGRDLPPVARLEEIVDLLVKETGATQDVTPLRMMLRSLRLLAKVTRPLEACIGPKQFEQLGLAFLRLTRGMWARLARIRYHPESLRDAVHGELLLLGAHSSFGRNLLEELARQEEDIVWSGLVHAAGMDWAQTLAVIQQAAHRLARVEALADTEGLRHINVEEQAEITLILAFAPQEQMPDFLVHMLESPPEVRSMMTLYMLSVRLDGVREMPDGAEKLLELTRLTEVSRLLALESPWQPESFNRLAWLAYARRLSLLLRPFKQFSLEDRVTLARVGRDAVAALEEAPRIPPPDELREWWEDVVGILESIDGLCSLLEAVELGELELVDGKFIQLPKA
jgi:transcriptional regulator with XRE-family HTH domain